VQTEKKTGDTSFITHRPIIAAADAANITTKYYYDYCCNFRQTVPISPACVMITLNSKIFKQQGARHAAAECDAI